MSIASMTGFAREAGVTGPYQWAWEIKSVNGRGLDVRIRTPPGFDGIGEEARGLLSKSLARGQCQLNLTLTKATVTPRARINREVLASLVEALAHLELPSGMRPASVDGLLAVRGVIEVEDDIGDPATDETLIRELRAGVPRLIAAVQAMRRTEGQALLGVLESQLQTIARLTAAAEHSPARQPEAIRARLNAQIAALMDGQGQLDASRLHQEAMLIAARADIREELDRLRAHHEAVTALLASGGPVGRRLDFLAQELGREANTLCAKANDISLSRIGLDLKAVIEQFREQVQNVE